MANRELRNRILVLDDTTESAQIERVLKALDYLHRAKVGENGANIIHRDVNPNNILLSVQGDVKLTDFGVAEVEGMMQGEAGAMRGTMAYMSPEQVLGQPVDTRTDLYAVGIILWELFANKRLYGETGEAELALKVRDARVPLLSSLNLGLPDYAAYTNGHHEGQRYFEMFDSLMRYTLNTGRRLAAGHTMQLGADDYLRCRAPTKDEPWLESKGEMLVVEVIRADQINR